MLNIGGPELLVILLVALVVLGPERLPGAARQVGRTVNQLRSMAQGFQRELEAATSTELSSTELTSTGTDPEQIRTAAKTSGAALFGGTEADGEPKPKSDGGPAEASDGGSQLPSAGAVDDSEGAADSEGLADSHEAASAGAEEEE